MLKQLTIRNYALIRHLEFQPGDSLNAITGETGAGKSILLGAIGLLMGNRADTKVLLDASEKCIAEGVFAIGAYGLEQLFTEFELDHQEETILRREISPAGKSRAFINDTPVTLDVLRTIGFRLMDIHSQHENLELGSQSFQLRLVDAYTGQQAQAAAYREEWNRFRSAQEALNRLQDESARLRQEADFIRFQQEELETAGLRTGEETELDTRLKQAEHAGLLRQRLQELINLFGEQEFSVTGSLSSARSLLQSVASISPAYTELLRRVESLRAEAADLLGEFEKESDDVNFNPAETEQQRARLDFLYSLQRKHRVNSSEELIEVLGRYREQTERTDHLEDDLRKLSEETEAARRSLTGKGLALSSSRIQAFAPLTKEMVSLLHELGIPDAQIVFERTDAAPGPTGLDHLRILFSANKGVPARPIADAASGGEFSRLMLVVKSVLASRTSLPTLIMDEIDTGVSGEIALKMGTLMQRMATRHQIIAISHLPQIAARADHHFVVFKENHAERTSSNLKRLPAGERVEEIARMLSGAAPSASALQYARELMG